MVSFSPSRFSGWLLASGCVSVVLTAGVACLEAEEALSFNRDVRPILSDRCFTCHGPDQKARTGLRLDTPEGAFSALESGGFALVPGHPEKSDLVRRIFSSDPTQVMPPPDSGLTLKDEEKAILRRWVEAGAQWEGHWAFVAPKRPAAPTVRDRAWPRNGIDGFILQRLEAEGLAPSREADPRTLIRRVTYDLTGLPPTPEEIGAFLSDESPDAFEKVVDRLLASPRFGERVAMDWLDAARYADTSGFHHDDVRFMWRWREWVIDAVNDNLPYDEFVRWQIAGDLIPNATLEQKIATGFNRNHGITAEGGAINEEYRVHYVADRVATTSTVFLGLTMDCAKCHDHKYDPISQKEFYQLSAFFNQVPERGLGKRRGNNDPVIRAPTRQQMAQLNRIDERLAELDAEIRAPMPELDARQRAWEESVVREFAGNWKILTPESTVSEGGATATTLDDGSVLFSGKNPAKDVHTFTFKTEETGLRALRLEGMMDASLPQKGPGRATNGNVVLSEAVLEAVSLADPEKKQEVAFSAAWANHSQGNADFHVSNLIDGDVGTGWAIDSHRARGARQAVLVATEPFGFPGGTELRLTLRYATQHTAHIFGRVRAAVTTDAETLEKVPADLDSWLLAGPFPAADFKTAHETAFGPEAGEKIADPAARFLDDKVSWAMRFDFPDAKVNSLSGENAANYLYRPVFVPTARTLTFSFGSDDALKVWLNGDEVVNFAGARGAAADQNVVRVDLKPGINHLMLKVTNGGGASGFYFAAKDNHPAGGRNLAAGAVASSPDGHDSDGGSKGDAAAIDGDPDTYWDEVDNQKVYRLRVAFSEPQDVGLLKITGYEQHRFAPRDFKVLVDGKTATTVNGLVYTNNRAEVAFSPVKGSSVELEITGYYGKSPGIRELEIFSDALITPEVLTILATGPEGRTEDQSNRIRDLYRGRHWPEAASLFAERNTLAEERSAIDMGVSTVMVMADMDKPRSTYILRRGAYDQHGEEVQAGVPAFLPPLPEGAPANRLGLAEWMVSPENPLLSRVAVNRLWASLFGTGIVETIEDFGSQGAWPSHPELLDWLAVEFRENGWDFKQMVKTIVMSSTYRQNSAVTPELMERDPENRLVARGPRFRLPAEAIRDTALLTSGLLVEKIGGPSVKPYQPAGLWAEISFRNGESYKEDTGEALYRRSIYTFWKRTIVNPTMSTFDAPDREVCWVERSRTNTPLQALALMNEKIYIEASRHLAQSVMQERPEAKAAEKIALAFERLTARLPDFDESAMLASYYAAERDRFMAEPDAAEKLLAVGSSPYDESLPTPDLAALTMVASAVLNLDETIMKD